MDSFDPIVTALIIRAYERAPEQLTGMSRLNYLAQSKAELVRDASVLRALAGEVDLQSSAGAVKARANAAQLAQEKAANAPPPAHVQKLLSNLKIGPLEQRVREAQGKLSMEQAAVDGLSVRLSQMEAGPQRGEWEQALESASDRAAGAKNRLAAAEAALAAAQRDPANTNAHGGSEIRPVI